MHIVVHHNVQSERVIKRVHDARKEIMKKVMRNTRHSLIGKMNKVRTRISRPKGLLCDMQVISTPLHVSSSFRRRAGRNQDATSPEPCDMGAASGRCETETGIKLVEPVKVPLENPLSHGRRGTARTSVLSDGG